MESKRRAKPMKKRMRRLKAEMKTVRKEQDGIREGQRQVRNKWTEINHECEQLRRETNRIIQQSADTQLRLSIMFNILKAREQNDFATAHKLTALLRELVGKDTC